MVNALIVNDTRYNIESDKYCCIGPYKIFENVTNEFSDMKYLVCLDYCSKRTMIAAFNHLDDAEVCCSARNATVLEFQN